MMNDLNKKSIEELKKLEEESRAELFALRFQAAMGNVEKPHRIRELRKNIARILTVLSARQKAGENVKVNVKIDLNETYAKIEQQSQQFAKERKAKMESVIAAQEQSNPYSDLMDLPLPESSEEVLSPDPLTVTATEVNSPVASESKPKVKKPKKAQVSSQEDNALNVENNVENNAPEQEDVVPSSVQQDFAPSVALQSEENLVVKKPKKPTSPKKPPQTIAEPQSSSRSSSQPKREKSSVKVKETTVKEKPVAVSPVLAPKASQSTSSVKLPTTPNAKDKIAEMKKQLAVGTAKGKGTGINIELTTKVKDPNAKEYTYGENWKENRDKINEAVSKKPLVTTPNTPKPTTTNKKKGNSK